MTNLSPIRKVFQGVTTRQQMFSLFDRHAQRPNRWEDDASALYAGEWFEVAEADHDYMFVGQEVELLKTVRMSNPENIFVQVGIQARPIRKLEPSMAER